MSAIKKEELEKLEKQYGLEEDGLSYQHRCSRITAYMNGTDWEPPAKPESKQELTTSTIESHPLYGKRILITPLMRPDAKRNLAFDENLGPEIEVREFDAGEALYGKREDVTNMVGDYEIIRRDESKQVIGKTTFPKIGTEISWCIGKELCPIVRGNNNEIGYIWSLPTQVIQIGDSLIQIYGLKTIIQSTFPELLPKFADKPMMSYIDGVTLAASIPLTEATIREAARQRSIDARAGLSY